MKLRFTVILFTGMLYAASAFAQTTGKKSSITLQTADAQGRVAVAVDIDKMPAQKFVLEIPELFTSQTLKGEHFNYSKQIWNYRPDGADMKLSDDKYSYEIHLDKVETKKTVGLKWKIYFTNNTSESVEDLIAFNCWTMNFAPLFKDVEMKRTFVLDSTRKKVPLESVQKTQGQGRRNMQYYPVKESKVDLFQSPWIRNWNVISNQKLNGNCISIVSTDSKWIFENKVNGKVAFFFNNFEEDHGCIHASPLLAKVLKSGKTASASGVFLFTKL